ncbi:MAG: hypothetical protein JL55_25845 [Pseudomonas sp. BICA1-14]|nr:MAG: hypothetical protein JL55_25845 [[Pseudomonas] sp. BICA1-14]
MVTLINKVKLRQNIQPSRNSTFIKITVTVISVNLCKSIFILAFYTVNIIQPHSIIPTNFNIRITDIYRCRMPNTRQCCTQHNCRDHQAQLIKRRLV